MILADTSALIAMLGLYLSFKYGFEGLPPELLSAIGQVLEPATIAAVFALLVPLAMFFAALLLMLSIYARSYKEAVSIISPLTIVVLVPAMPTGQLDWGGLALVAGLSLAPAVADEVIGLLDADHPTRGAETAAGVALGLAVTGMFFTHSSELVTVAVVVLCLVLGDRALRPLLRHWRKTVEPDSPFHYARLFVLHRAVR